MVRPEPEPTRWREVSPDVFYTDSVPVQANAADVRLLQDKARTSPRGRARLCAHPAPHAGLHEMLICLSRGTYIRPHRHFAPESALILRGTCELVLFEEDGAIADVLPLSDSTTEGSFFVRLAEPVYHTYVLSTDFLLFLETKPGPLDPSLTEFAPWAPPEPGGDYLEDLRRRVLEARPQ